MEAILTVDVGTTRLKAAVCGRHGRILGSASVTGELNYEGGVTQDPIQLMNQVAEVAAQAVQQGGLSGAKVAAISVSGQMGSWLGIDEAGEPVTPLDSYLDARYYSVKERVMARAGEEILRWNGITPFVAPKIRWWMEQHSEVMRRVAKAVAPGNFVAGRLAGLRADQAFVDRSQMWIWGVADIANARWLPELCTTFGIDRGLLPAIREPWDLVGELQEPWAGRIGLPTRVPIVAGLGDGMAGWLGTGAVRPAIAVDTAASTDHIAIGLPAFRPDVRHGILACSPSVLPGLWHHQGFAIGTGNVYRWLRHSLGLTDELEKAAAILPPGSEGLIICPHFSGRVSPDQPALRGTIIGLEWHHTRAHIYRAYLESVACEYANYARVSEDISGSRLAEVRVIGGGARNHLWNQIKADVLGVPYKVLADQDFAAQGAAVVAGLALGWHTLAQVSDRPEPPVETVLQPDFDAHKRSEAIVERYLGALRNLNGVYGKGAGA